MKKLIVLFILSITISSCSNDDNTANTTVLEGDWLLVYQYGGDPPPGQEPPGDISNQNIKYHFKENIQKITKNDEILHSEITFTLNKEGDDYLFSYKDTEFNEISNSRVTFTNDNTIASFKAMVIDAGYTLKKIQ